MIYVKKIFEHVIIRKIAIALLAIIFISSLSIWLFINIQQDSASKKPAMAIQTRFAIYQVCGRNDGIHFLLTKSYNRELFRVKFEHVNYIGYDGYSFGYVVNAFGLALAISPKNTGGYDYIVPPYIAMAIPYWFLITVTGLLLILLTPIAGWIATYCRPRKINTAAGVIVIVIFLLLNIVPFDSWRPGTGIEPQSLKAWITLTINPLKDNPDVMLVYGFPFKCYEKGYIDRTPVDLYYGATVGWQSYKVMENLCIALFSTFITMFFVGWFVILVSKKSKCREMEIAQVNFVKK